MLLFAVAGFFALLLIVGYRTKIASVVSFLLLLSLQARAPVVLNGGDTILLPLLFISVFLPLSDRFSIDSVRKGTRTRNVEGVVSAAPLVYLSIMVFWVNSLVKLQGDLWIQGEAVQRVFRIDSMTILLGDILAGYPSLLSVIDWLWLSLLLAAPLLIFLSGWYRVFFVGLFVGAEVGMLVTLRLGLFPLVVTAGLILFLPSVFWDYLEDVDFSTPSLDDYSDDMRRLLWLDVEPTVPERAKTMFRTIGAFVVGSLLVLGLVWAFLGTGIVEAPNETGPLSEVDGYVWTMFAPEPYATEGWYVAPARFKSGRTVDAHRLSNVRWDEPSNYLSVYPTVSWYNYLYFNTRMRLASADPRLQRAFARYLCLRAERGYGEPVTELEVYYVERDLRGGSTERRELVSTGCS